MSDSKEEQKIHLGIWSYEAFRGKEETYFWTKAIMGLFKHEFHVTELTGNQLNDVLEYCIAVIQRDFHSKRLTNSQWCGIIDRLTEEKGRRYSEKLSSLDATPVRRVRTKGLDNVVNAVLQDGIKYKKLKSVYDAIRTKGRIEKLEDVAILTDNGISAHLNKFHNGWKTIKII